MINVLLSGCNGHMGQVITRLSENFCELKIAAGLDLNNSVNNPYPVFTSLNDCDIKVDVIIDFSNPKAFDGLMEYAQEKRIPVVMCTTGLSSDQTGMLKNDIAKRIPVFFSANMSLGVNLLIELVKKAAKLLEGQFDIEIVEKHHNQKIDAPSGTALAIADAINDSLDEKYEYTYDRHSRRKKRGKQEIGMHAVRGGTIVGDHSVIFAGKDEIIEINHTAASKEIFGVGALKAAMFLADKKPGLYSMSDLIAENN
ncbi:4-hydroxy-tetrahydrodipicolinate reductase [Ruminiclostridium sufflavum]|nr:4-hydroxy-tetrahydrodipicolinate reductase [Ruminiclostridium sufflavum]